MKKEAPPASTVLPLDARDLLRQAAAIPDARDRARAIDDAVRRIRFKYPHLFNHGKE